MVQKKATNKVFASLHKTLFQARYKPELEFYELLYSVAKKFDNFPDWKTDRLSVVLRNFSKRCSLGIQHTNFSYDQDTNSITDEEFNLNKAIEIIPQYLKISSFVRLGYRRIYLISTDMQFQELVDILNIKFFSHETELIKIMPSKVYDLQYVIDSTDDPFRFHIRIGPVRKEEIPSRIPFNKENHLAPKTTQKDYEQITSSYPKVAVFIDLDCTSSNNSDTRPDFVSDSFALSL